MLNPWPKISTVLTGQQVSTCLRGTFISDWRQQSSRRSGRLRRPYWGLPPSHHGANSSSRSPPQLCLELHGPRRRSSIVIDVDELQDSRCSNWKLMQGTRISEETSA